MRTFFYRGRFIFIPLGIAAFLSLISFIVMTLWNDLLPGILHVGVITFWQAMGIFILSKILFGFGKGGRNRWGHGGNSWMRRRMEEKFKNMSPEEKERFKAKWEHRCGPRRWGPDADWDNYKPEAEKTAE